MQAEKILRADHWLFVSCFIRTQIDELDEREQELRKEGPDEKLSEDIGLGHFVLGSKQSPIPFQEVEAAHSTDTAFKDFRKWLIPFLNSLLLASNIALPNATRGVQFTSNDTVRVYTNCASETLNTYTYHCVSDCGVPIPEDQL